MPLLRFVSRALRPTASCVLVAALAACGGGGGDAPAYSGPVTLSGTASYDSVPPTSSGALDYTGIEAKPIRGATVQLLDSAGQVLATTRTDEQGQYSFSLAQSQSLQVRVRAEIKPASGEADITVRDNTQGGALYVLDSGTFSPDAASITRDLRAGSGWGGTSYTGTRAAGPFAILDVAYAGQQKIAAVAPSRVLPALKMFWSVNNRPAAGDPATGAIQTSMFTTDDTTGEPVLYILGQQNVDTDEYDSHVVAHEFGHFVTSAVSRDDSIGGSHALGERLDPRVAFSEGFANGWAGMVTDNAIYTDTMGTRQEAGFAVNLGEAPVGLDRGWYSETTMQYLAWTTYAQAGFAPIYTALAGMATAPAPNTIYTFAAALPAGTSVNLGAVNITGTGPYGIGETNDGGNALNLPVYKDHPVGSVQTYCLRTDAGSEGNKLGNTLFLKFNLSAGSHTVSVSRNAMSTTSAMDPDFMLVTPAGARHVALAEGSSDSLTRTLAGGTHTLALHDYEWLVAPSTAQRCYDITVN